MRSLLIQLILFVVFLMPILYGVNYGVAYVKYEYFARQKFDELTNPKVNAEIIILGACRPLAGIDVKVLESLNANIFNFALQGVNPVYLEMWYTQLFKNYYKKPALILYSVEMDQFTDSRNLNQDSEYYPLGFFIKKLLDKDAPRKILILNRFATTKYMPLYQMLKGAGDHWAMERRYYRGHVPLKKRERLPAGDRNGADATPSEGYKNEPRHVESFKKLIKMFQKEGIPVVYIIIPDYYTNKKSFLPAKGIQEIVKILREAENGSDIFFLDYNNVLFSDINRDESLYYDPHNLCDKGSYLFSQRLRKDLARTILPAQEQIFERNPSYDSALNMVSICVSAEDEALAQKFIREARELAPENANSDIVKIYAGMGNIYFDHKEYQKARPYYERVIEMDPEHSEALINLGETYFSNNEYKKALECLLKAVEFKPDHAPIHFYIGTIYAKLKDYKQAETAFKRAVELNPDNHEYFNNLGYVYFQIKDYPNALTAYLRAKEIKPNDRIANEYLENILIVMNQAR